MIIKQANGEYGLKESALMPYRAVIQMLVGKLQSVRYEHTTRSTNRYVDALATLVSKVPIQTTESNLTIKVIKKSITYTTLNLLDEEPEAHGDWRCPIKEQLAHPATASVATLRNFININGVLYYKGLEGILSRCIGVKEACLKLDK